MGFLKNILSMFKPVAYSIEFQQSCNFRGFKRYKIANYGFEEAQENINTIRSQNPKLDFKDSIIRIELSTAVTGVEYLGIFADGLRIGSIFFDNGKYSDLLKAFKQGKISAACVNARDDELYFYAKLEE